MRSLIKQIALLERVDQLIRLKATGRPKDLADRLEVSEATVFRLIEVMKQLDAPISYDLSRQSYVYSQAARFICGFFGEEQDSLTKSTQATDTRLKPPLPAELAKFLRDSQELRAFGRILLPEFKDSQTSR